MAMIIYLLIVNINVNELNAPVKRYREAEWIKQQDPSISCLQETHLRLKGTHVLKVKGQSKIFHTNENEKQARIAILISDKID